MRLAAAFAELEALVPRDREEEDVDLERRVDHDRPGPGDRAARRHAGEGLALDAHLEPGVEVRGEPERRVLDQRVEPEEAARAQAGRLEARLEPAAELERVRGDGEVALGAHVDAGD